MVERALDNPGVARAFLRICGTSAARQQLAAALALECERIVCIAPSLSSELVELQHLAEAAGARFHVIANHRALAGLVTATDEVIAFADGLLLTGAQAATVLEKGTGVVVQPVEQGLAQGFERIDLNTAAAGAFRAPGRLVSQLNDLPPDCDAFSTLQRIALQSGVAAKPLPPIDTESGFWTLVASDAQAHQIEPRWIRSRLGKGSATAAPGRWIVTRAIGLFGAAILDAGSGRAAVLAGGATLGLLAFFAGWYGLVLLGIGLAALSWLAIVLYRMLGRIGSDPVRTGGVGALVDGTALWLIDGLFVALAGWGSGLKHWQPEIDRFFPALMLLLVLRLAALVAERRLAAWLNDRLILAVGLGAAIATGFGAEALRAGAVILAVFGLYAARRSKRITWP